MYWTVKVSQILKYLYCILCSNYVLANDAVETQESTLKDLLIFATGVDSIPPLGFPTKPVLTFLHSEDKYPLANTCALQLKLPTVRGV